MSAFGKLYLLPVPIAPVSPEQVIPGYNFGIIKTLKHFVVENEKTARGMLKRFGYDDPGSAEIQVLNEHSRPSEVPAMLKPLLEGHHTGLMSEAGCPCIADPGAAMVRLAHQKNIEVIPLTGPSALLLSMMASGFNGQNFAFCGYLPQDRHQRSKKIKELEQMAFKNNQAQYFIETPYRNRQLADALLSTLSPQASLFIGINLTSQEQFVSSKTVSEWKKTGLPEMHKSPAVYAIFR